MDNSGNGLFSQYYYQTDAFSGVFGGNGWREVGDINTDRSTVRVSPDAGILVKRSFGENPLFLISSGTVSLESLITPLVPGFNVVSSSYPVGSTLSESGLYTEISGGLISGQDDSSSDIIYVLQADGTYDQFYRQTDAFSGVFGGDGWRAVGDIETPQDTYLIPAGSALIIKHIGSGTFWTRSPSYATTALN
jgi:hypothetical protein